MIIMQVYLDNAATTRVDEKVLEVMAGASLQNYANASSIHHMGIAAREIVEDARAQIALHLQADAKEIIFTSGGTEANNLAIKGLAFANPKKKHIITTKIEHDCVLNACKWLQETGYEITFLEVNEEGFVDAREIEARIRQDTLLVSIIHANNEIGTLQDLDEIYQICKKNKVIFHTDACQSFSKAPISTKQADMITLNAHKLHGPKGIGALYVRKGIKLAPIAHGGGHEFGLRSGTENVPAIAGFAAAAKMAFEEKVNIEKMQELRDYFISQALKIEGSRLNGPAGEMRLCNNINISFNSIEGESIAAYLDTKGICISTGSACASKSLEPSHVIMAISKNDSERAHGSIRVSLSKYSTKEEMDYALKALKEAVAYLRKISPIG